jgi:hypothetical protein
MKQKKGRLFGIVVSVSHAVLVDVRVLLGYKFINK